MAGALESYVSFAQGRISHAVGCIGPTRHKDRAILAELVKGPQAGSLAVLDAKSFTIGPDIEDDLFVFGAEDAGSVEVRVVPTLMGPLVSFRSSRTDISLDGCPVVAGMAGPERLPCELCLDGSAIRFRPPQDLIEGYRHRSPMALVMTVAVIGAAFIAPLASQTSEVRMVSLRAPLPTASLPPERLLENAGNIVSEAGLENLVEMRRDPSGAIELSGTLTGAQGDLWTRLRPRLDSALGGVPVRDAVTIRSGPGRFPNVSMIVQGPQPFVVLSDGSRRQLGDVIADGFRLSAVDATHFHLSRGDEKIAIAY